MRTAWHAEVFSFATLVLPNDLAESSAVMRSLASAVSPDTYVHVMTQYRPCHRAGEVPELDRAVTKKEHARAVRAAVDAGLHHLV
jgi:putative pyruvate formate lyase activating enzyme